MIGGSSQAMGVAQRRTHKVMRYPAPSGGMDIRKAIGSEDLMHCVYTYNLLPFEYGLRVRTGFREWQVGVDTAVSSGVHTLIAFDAATEGGVGDRLFAVNNEGIWDTTDFDTAPVQVAVFIDQDVDAGYGTFTHYVNQAEVDVLMYADNINGLWTYEAGVWTTGNTISVASAISDADVKYVMSFKNNVWFAAKNSTIGYYLPILSASGDVTAQHFGDKFQHGGTLEGLFSWSVDGGDGVDDILVAVSHAGDVILYQGDGPDATNWGMRGIYYIGEIPNTPRFGSEQGGELYLLSAYGVTSMNDLLQGVDTAALQADVEGISMAYKIAGLLRGAMKDKISLRGWDVSLIPSEGGILISVPTIGSEAPIQFYYNLAVRGWGIWRDVPMLCFTEYQDSIFFGTADSRVMRMDVPVDNVLINPVDPLLNGDDIEFSILSSFNPMGVEGIFKQVQLIRPDFISRLPPSHSSQARYDYDISEGIDFDSTAPIGQPVGVWDVTNWDQAVWGSSAGQTFPSIGGAWGKGRYVAIATKGSSRADTRLVGWDVVYTVGGPMG